MSEISYDVTMADSLELFTISIKYQYQALQGIQLAIVRYSADDDELGKGCKKSLVDSCIH